MLVEDAKEAREFHLRETSPWPLQAPGLLSTRMWGGARQGPSSSSLLLPQESGGQEWDVTSKGQWGPSSSNTLRPTLGFYTPTPWSWSLFICPLNQDLTA